jgi:hypothetical protein
MLPTDITPSAARQEVQAKRKGCEGVYTRIRKTRSKLAHCGLTCRHLCVENSSEYPVHDVSLAGKVTQAGAPKLKRRGKRAPCGGQVLLPQVHRKR